MDENAKPPKSRGDGIVSQALRLGSATAALRRTKGELDALLVA